MPRKSLRMHIIYICALGIGIMHRSRFTGLRGKRGEWREGTRGELIKLRVAPRIDDVAFIWPNLPRKHICLFGKKFPAESLSSNPTYLLHPPRALCCRSYFLRAMDIFHEPKSIRTVGQKIFLENLMKTQINSPFPRE